MAEGLLNALYGAYYKAYSAGTHPATVHPCAIQVMQEIGIDISGHRSKHLDEFRDQQFDRVVTLCDSSREACPVFSNAETHLHESFPDPSQQGGSSDEVLKAFRLVRDSIQEWITCVF
jgi:arsenate reductase